MNPTDWTMQRLEPLATQLVATLLPEMLTFAAAMVGIAALAALLLDGIGPRCAGSGAVAPPMKRPPPRAATITPAVPASVSAPRLQDQVERRLGCAPEMREARLPEHLRQPRLPRLRAQHQVAAVGDRVRSAQ